VTADLATDPEARFEFLCEHGVLVETDDGVATTERYDAIRDIYHATYHDVDDEIFHGTIASLFDIPPEEAPERVAELGVTRAELIAYLALESHLDDVAPDLTLDRTAHVHLAAMVVGVSPVSPVPDAMPELTDDDYEAFLDEHPDAVVFVWKLHCDPCDVMKRELDDILAALPERVAVAGIDGEAVNDFRRDFDVTAAPATLTFADGAFVECVTGRRSAAQLSQMFAVAYGSSPALD
jgi:thiol-disulfide isomerase/thioredoxin